MFQSRNESKLIVHSVIWEAILVFLPLDAKCLLQIEQESNNSCVMCLSIMTLSQVQVQVLLAAIYNIIVSPLFMQHGTVTSQLSVLTSRRDHT